MKKIMLSMFCIFLLVGCSTKQENITIKKNNNQETVDLKVGFGLHHIEDGYSFDGNDVDINYDYEVVGRDANFGLMIFINGIPQMIKHEDKESLVYTFKGKKDTNKTEHVSIMPNTGSKGDHLYMHAFLIADYEIVDSLKQLTNKQHMMACGTTFIDIHQDTANNPIDLNNNYDLIDYTSDLLKHDEEGYFDNNLLIQFPNNLEGNFKKNKPITIKMSGISDNYILWVLEDLKPVSSYHIELPKNKSAVLSYKPGNKTKNVKAIAIPLSSNLPMNIYINDLSKYYKNKKALDHITLHLSSGIYGLIGPNGAGKTTFLSILCGLIKNDSGTIEIDEVKFLSDDFYHVFGYVPQSPALYVDLTCNEFLEYICALKSIDKNQIDHTLRLVNLYDQKYIKIKKLSGGMKQRLSIAQAIINDPQILLLDEPTTGLDPIERLRLKNLLRNLSKNKIIIISTHIIQDMDHLAKSLIFFKNGQLLDFKSPQELILSLKQFFYETIVSKNDLQKYIETYHVSSIVPINDDYKIKFFSHKDELFPHCKEINLEDIYLYYYGDVYDKR